MPSVKCSVVYVSPLLFYVWASPRRRTYTRARAPATRTRAHTRRTRVHVGARTERLKLIRVYDRRIKCRCRVSREDRQLTCRTALYAPPSSHSPSLFQYSYLAKSRRSHGALSSRGDCCAVRCEISRRKCGIALFTRAFIIKVRAYSVIIEITCYERKQSNK